MSRSRNIAAETMYTAFQILKENNYEMPGNKLIEEIGKRAQLDDYAKETYQKTGGVRWQSITHFFSIDCQKAGFLIKKKGVWYLTKEGEAAMALGKHNLLDEATKKYWEWKNSRDAAEPEDTQDPVKSDETQPQAAEIQFEKAESDAFEGISNYINSLGAYEFQDLCAALLRGMGYYTPFIALKGKDGGVDIYAYKDPLGASTPRIKVQVKHRENKATSQELRQLKGLLNPNDDVGIFISSGGFTSDAKIEFRNSHPHIELIDMETFVDLWQEFYTKLNEEDKVKMPIKPVYFIAK